MDASLAILNADVVTVDGVRRSDVLVNDGLITAVGPDLSVGSAARTVDAADRKSTRLNSSHT